MVFQTFCEKGVAQLTMEPKTILVVDSNEATLRTFKRLLQNQGFSVDEAAKKEEAIYKMRNKRYDIVLVSSLLPDTDGIDLFLYTKTSMSDALKMVKNGLPFSKEIDEKFEGGAEVAFSKPVAPVELLRKIAQLQE